MARRAPGGRRIESLTGRRNGSPLLRFASRLFAAAVAVVVVCLVLVQFVRVASSNISMASELHRVNADVASLTMKRRHELEDIRRLSDPRGAIPEIHARLHLVLANEELVLIERSPKPRDR